MNKQTTPPAVLFGYTYSDTRKKSDFELNLEARIATTKEKERSVESDTAQPANNPKQ